MNQIVITDQPFLKGRRIELPEGLTLQEMLACQALPPFFEEDGVVCVGEREIPRHLWPIAKPKDGHKIRVFVRLKGGKTRSVLALVATIAVVAAATFVSGGGLLPFLGGAFAAAHIGAVVGAAAISILGALAVGRITGSGGRQDNSSIGNDGAPNTASLSGNILNPGGRLPRSIGRNLMFPPFICRPLTETIADDVYIEGVVALCGAHVWEEFRSGGSNVAEMTDVQVESRPGLPGDTPMTLVTRYGWEAADPITLSQLVLDATSSGSTLKDVADPGKDLPQWHRVITKKTPDEFWLTYEWPEGLWDEADIGRNRYVTFRHRIRRRGATSWTNLPELLYFGHPNRTFRRMVKLIWTVAPTAPTPPTTEGFIRAYKSVPAAAAAIVVTPGGWLAHSYFNGGANIYDTANVSLYKDRAEIYLDPATFPKDIYEVEVMKGTSINDNNFNPLDYTGFGLGVVDMYGYRGSPGSYNFYGQDSRGVHDGMKLVLNASVRNTNPVQNYGTDAVAAIRVKNRRVDQFSAIVSGITYGWSGNDWSVQSTTSNPAPHLHQMYTDPTLSAYTYSEDMIDSDSMKDWLDFCELNNLKANIPVENESFDDVRTMLVAAGQGIIKGLDALGLAWEHDRSAESPIHAITPVNSRSDQWNIPFDKKPDALLVTFRDENDDWNNAQITVFDDGVTADNAQFYDSATYNFITNRQQAADHALKEMRRARLRSVVHRREIPAEGILLEAGDLIAVQDDVLTRVAGHTRIKSTLMSGANVTGLTLYSKIPVRTELGVFATLGFFNTPSVFDLGMQTGVALKSKNGTILTKPITDASGDLDTITFATPFVPPADGIQKGDMIWSGPVDEEHKRMLVLAIEPPNQDLEFSLLLVDEAPDIVAATPDVEMDEDTAPAPGDMAILDTFALGVGDPAQKGVLVDVYFDPIVDLGCVAGDFVLVFCGNRAFASNGAIPPTNPPTGWTAAYQYTTIIKRCVYGRKITGTEISREFLHQVDLYDLFAVRFSNALTASYSTPTEAAADGDINQTVASSSGTIPSIAWAIASTNTNIDRPSTTLTMKESSSPVEDLDMSGYLFRIKIAIDNLAVTNKAIYQGDEGYNNALASGFVSFS